MTPLDPNSKNWILLRSGAPYVFGRNDCKLDFRQDTVVPLSRIARYGGHTTWTWVVAAHAACCAELALKFNMGKVIAKHGLHHDDGESLVGDMVSPLKRQLPGFDKFEEAAQQCIANNAGYDLPSEDEAALVKALDMAMLEAERRLIKAPLTQGLTWNIKFDPNLADEAERLVYAAILRKENEGQGAYDFYMRMYTELA